MADRLEERYWAHPVMETPQAPPTPGQRWVSRTEPELGLGTILDVDERSVTIRFTAAAETRRYIGRDAPLRRVRFNVGDEVKDQSGGSFLVETVEELDGLLVYIGQGQLLVETSVSDEVRFNDPSERLVNGHVDSGASYEFRRVALMQQARINGSAQRGFVGGRIDLMPHQLFVAQQVAARHCPRVLLADEPGLGKTIEACLILHRLLLNGRVQRALIVVPDQLVPQWMVELKRRFNLTFCVYDEERCLAVEEESEGANPFTEDQLILCGLSVVTAPHRSQQAVQAGWDMVVVDEAHHLHWTPDAPSEQYTVVESLARVSAGLLLLTATPEQLGKASHFARLRLLDPERYPALQAFLDEPKQHPQVALLAENLLKGAPQSNEDMDSLRELLAHDVDALNEDQLRLQAGDVEAAQHWARCLLDLHGPGRVMFRNTRAAIAGFPPRRVHLIPLPDADAPLLAAVSAELLAELTLGEGPKKLAYATDPRVAWLIDHLQAAPENKVLLICTTTAKCLAIEAALRERANVRAAVFHEQLTIVQRDRNAAWFAEASGAQVLICSEIGSEGRNFQFAHHLVLFDLPCDPDLLEQRIGRLERIGQTHEIQLHLPYLPGSAQEVLLRWIHEGVQAIERSTSAGSNFLERFGPRVKQLVKSAAAGTLVHTELEALLDESRAYRTEVADALEQGRDRIIELTSYRPGASDALIEAVQKYDQGPEIESFFVGLMERLGVYSEEFQPRSYLLNPDNLSVDEFPELEQGETRITFDRTTALERWDVEFLSLDHPLLQRALDTLLLSNKGSSSFCLWEDDGAGTMMLEALFVVESLAPTDLHIERFLSSRPLRLLVDHKQDELTDELSPEQLEDVLTDAQPAWLASNQAAIQRLVPGMTRRLQKLAKEHLPDRIAEAEDAFDATLRLDLARLRMLMRVNKHIRPEELAQAEAQVERIAEYIQAADVRLQSLRLIWRGPCKQGCPRLG